MIELHLVDGAGIVTAWLLDRDGRCCGDELVNVCFSPRTGEVIYLDRMYWPPGATRAVARYHVAIMEERR